MPDEPEQLGLAPEILPAEPRPRRGIPGSQFGRPRGSKNRANEKLAQLARGYAPDIVRRLCELALHDNSIVGLAAAKMILDRLWPRPRHAAVQIDLAQLNNNGARPDLHALMGEVLSRTAAGEIAPETAHALAGLMKDAMRVIEQAPAIEQADLGFADDPRDELAKRWLKLYDTQNGNGHSHGDAEDAESAE